MNTRSIHIHVPQTTATEHTALRHQYGPKHAAMRHVDEVNAHSVPQPLEQHMATCHEYRADRMHYKHMATHCYMLQTCCKLRAMRHKLRVNLWHCAMYMGSKHHNTEPNTGSTYSDKSIHGSTSQIRVITHQSLTDIGPIYSIHRVYK